MKKFVVSILALLILTGCDSSTKELDAAMALRTSILQASACTFTAEITADYGDELWQFTVDSELNARGNLSFTVVKPETIAGITGHLTGGEGEITFDDVVLHFPLLANGQLSPVSAPWILMQALRSGFLASACEEDGFVRLSIDDQWEEESIRLDIWMNADSKPVQADILHDGRRILTMNVTKFDIS